MVVYGVRVDGVLVLDVYVSLKGMCRVYGFGYRRVVGGCRVLLVGGIKYEILEFSLIRVRR